MSPKPVNITRKMIIVLISLGVGLLHFVTGTAYSGPFPLFVNGYLLDILLPFSMVLLLSLVEWKFVQNSIVRALTVFLIGSLSETLQLIGVPLFGRTYDPLDYLMFAIGVLLAIAFEKLVLVKFPSD